MSRFKKSLFALFCLILSLPETAEAAKISVAVSIKPIHSLVAGIMAGVGEPSLIVKGSRSPHSYSLKPSDARTLSHADVIIWVGPGMELFLQKPISALAEHTRIVALSESINGDPHLWLAPLRATSIVDRVLAALIEADPVHDTIYSNNALSIKRKLKDLQAYGIGKLTPVRKTPFLVFHDAWGRFAQSFSLSMTGAVALNPERPPGAKRIAIIRNLIEHDGIQCLFREPQFDSPLLTTILEDHLEMKVFELDPLGSVLQPGPDLYFQMMENNINAVASCLR